MLNVLDPRRSATVSVALALTLLGANAMAQQAPEDDLEIPARPRGARGDASAVTDASAADVSLTDASAVTDSGRAAGDPDVRPESARVEDELTAMRRLVATLDGRLRELERARPAAVTPPRPADAAPSQGFVRTTPTRPDAYSLLAPSALYVSGFAQIQHEWSQLSQDQLVQGVALNRDRFVLRRARLRVDGAWQWFTFALELDANTVRAPSVGPRRAEASFVVRNPANAGVPWVAVTAGLTEPAFGAELGEGVRRRWFMERSSGSLAFFPGEPDVGVRAWGGVGVFRYAVGVFNGAPVDERVAVTGWRAVDPSAQHDFSGRVGVDTQSDARAWSVAAGASFLAGTGFHPGEEATKPSIDWRDNNQNSMIDAGELVAVPGRAATPSVTFGRWAVNADLAVRFRTRAGLGRAFVEATLATNLDRGAFASDPIATGYPLRHLHAVAGFTQEITQYGILGFRWDFYNPNLDLFEDRRGVIEPKDQGLHTLSPLVGLTWPGHARLVFQYDIVLDSLARDARGIPTDLANNQATLRLQGDF